MKMLQNTKLAKGRRVRGSCIVEMRGRAG